MFDRSSAESECSAKNAIVDATNAREIIAVAIHPAFGSPIRLPHKSNTPAPIAGSNGMIQARSRRLRASISYPPRPLALQQIYVVGGDILSAPEDRHDDRQTDRDLGGRDDEREEHDHLAADVV